MITIVENKSASYAPRTFHNASKADLTIAVAINFFTGGEQLTKKAAKDRYLALPFEHDVIDNARLLYKECHRRKVKILNVAGNGIATFAKAGITRQEVNQYVYNLIAKVHKFHWIEKIVSGGQTGVDIAGGIAGYKLNIPVEMTYPLGFRQRNEAGDDQDYSREEIMQQVIDGAQALVV